MIRNNLAQLLAERGLKISKVAMDIPNLSRNTITSTAQNDGKMIQLSTIDSLCRYLKVTPEQFFSYIPFEVEISVSVDNIQIRQVHGKEINKYSDSWVGSLDGFNLLLDDLKFKVHITKTSDSEKKTFVFIGSQKKPFVRGNLDHKYLIQLMPDNLNVEQFKQFVSNDLTAGFRTDLFNNLKAEIADGVSIALKEMRYNLASEKIFDRREIETIQKEKIVYVVNNIFNDYVIL